MTKGKMLKAEKDEDRCQAQTVQTEWKRNRGVALHCPFFARVLIDGKRLCTKHAHMEALAIAFEKKIATQIDIPMVRIPGKRVPLV